MTMMMSLANLYLLLLLLFITLISSSSEEIVKINNNHQRRQMSSPSILEFTANLDYNKLYQRSLNIHHARVVQMEPKEKLWFAIENGTLYALPLFGDYPGPFLIRFQPWSNGSTTDLHPSIELNLNFNFTPSSSLFSPSNHLLLALFNMSSTNYNHSLLNRYYAVRTLALALNLSESLLTIHRINGSMIKVYFSCDLYISTNLTDQLKSLIDHYYSRRLQLVPLFSLPLIEISIVRVQKSTTTTTTTTTPLTTTLSTTSTSSTTTTTTTTTTSKTKTTTTTSSAPSIELKKAEVTIRPRLLNDHHPLKFNRTVTSLNNLFALKQFYQPLVLVPLAIITVGLFLCAIIACCLCCNRRSSSSSTLLIPTGSTSTSPTHKNLFRHYPYRKHRQKYDLSKKKHQYHDQRQFISKGIPVVFAEELEEKIEQTHTPLVMRIEKAPVQETVEAEAQPLDKSTL